MKPLHRRFDQSSASSPRFEQPRGATSRHWDRSKNQTFTVKVRCGVTCLSASNKAVRSEATFAVEPRLRSIQSGTLSIRIGAWLAQLPRPRTPEQKRAASPCPPERAFLQDVRHQARKLEIDAAAFSQRR